MLPTQTPAEENYLKAIYHLGQSGVRTVLTSEIALALQTTSASVTDMLKKLAEKNFIEYERYKGARMTRKGEKIALAVVRKHRLWEVFLTDVLKFEWDEVHDMAEQLEHVSSEELIKRLDQFLGHPRVDPHGDPIPDPQGKMQSFQQVRLSQAKAGSKVIISGVNDHQPAFLQFLRKKGLMPGTVITLMETDPFEKSLLLHRQDNNESLFLSNEVASQIFIRFNDER
jgi:DtxR family Mn-dependent transcriptional regulator